jgi:hypothetical protein
MQHGGDDGEVKDADRDQIGAVPATCFDEDRCRIRKYAGAQVMASLRSLAISLLRLAGAVHIAPALRACARDLRRPLRLLGLACQG